MTKPLLPHLTLVSFSGAHATGKSTLLGDLVDHFDGQPDTAVIATESCSSQLFKRITNGEVTLPQGAQVPKSYTDLNDFGLRAFFQRLLPDALTFEIQVAIERTLADKPYQPRTLLFVDRWFTDILAYTVVESDDVKLHDEVRDLCRACMSDLRVWLSDRAKKVEVVNVFVPVKASGFRVREVKKFRATGDRGKWETVCLSRWGELTPGRAGMLPIAMSDRDSRVVQVADYLDARQPSKT